MTTSTRLVRSDMARSPPLSSIAATITSCCTAVRLRERGPISSELYSDAERGGLPADAVTASLGCGNPTALAELKPGEDRARPRSGGGIDVLLSAKRVGPTGKAYGLDMTDEMLALARENQRKAGATNVEFLKGTIEAIPLPDNSVDVIISNCVINLSADKDAVLREAFRVLKPGGRFAVSDVVVRGEIPPSARHRAVGRLHRRRARRDRVRAEAGAAGFANVGSRTRGGHSADDARVFLAGGRPRRRRDSPRVMDQAPSPARSSAATKPQAKSCCGPECCA